MIEVSFRADVLREGIKAREIPLAPGGSITLDTDDTILRTAQLELYESVNELTEEIKPYMVMRTGERVIRSPVVYNFNVNEYTWAELDERNLMFDGLGRFMLDQDKTEPIYTDYPLGVFVPSTPTRRSVDGQTTWTVEAYDRTIILREDGLDEPLFFAARTKYIDAVLSVLVSAGLSTVTMIDYNETQIPADREFEVGASKIDVINTLLSEINYVPIYCDTEGRFVIEAYEEPMQAAPDVTYRANELSLIGRDTTIETDFYAVPNVFIAVCSNPDLDEDYRSVYVNDNPMSAFSTVRRGRRIVSEVYRPEQIATQADLDAFVRRKAFETTTSASETVNFTTALSPHHKRGADVELQHPDITGVFREARWVLPLDAAGEMEHMARRTVIL